MARKRSTKSQEQIAGASKHVNCDEGGHGVHQQAAACRCLKETARKRFVALYYREAVAASSPTLPRFAATLGRELG